MVLDGRSRQETVDLGEDHGEGQRMRMSRLHTQSSLSGETIREQAATRARKNSAEDRNYVRISDHRQKWEHRIGNRHRHTAIPSREGIV